MHLIWVSDLPSPLWAMRSRICVLILLVSPSLPRLPAMQLFLCECWGEGRMKDKGRKKKKKEGKSPTFCSSQSTFTSCSHLIWFPIRGHWGFSPKDCPWSLPPHYCLGTHACSRLSTQHNSHQPPKAHTIKGETNMEESQRSESFFNLASPARGPFHGLYTPQIRAHLSNLHHISATCLSCQACQTLAIPLQVPPIS